MKSNEFKIVNSEEFNVKNKKKKTGLKIAIGVIIAAILAAGAIFMLSGRNKLEGKWTVVEFGKISGDESLLEGLYSMVGSSIFKVGTQVEFTKNDMIVMGQAVKYKYKNGKLETTSQEGRTMADAVIKDNGQLVIEVDDYRLVLVKSDKAASAETSENKTSVNEQVDNKTTKNEEKRLNSSNTSNEKKKESTKGSAIFSGKIKFEVISKDFSGSEAKVMVKVINNSDKQISLFPQGIEIEDNNKNVTSLDIHKQLQNGGAEFSVFANEQKKFTFYFSSLEEADSYKLKFEQIWCNDPLYLNERAEVKLK